LEYPLHGSRIGMALKIPSKAPRDDKTSKIKRITESILGLPTLPTVVAQMIEMVDNPKTSAASLARLISSDQSLTAKILKLANSAYYGFPREISTVNLAIVVLGFNAVKDMGLSVSILEAFSNSAETDLFELTKFWEHSIGCGVAARMLAKKFNYRISGEAFVAGLLHDMGKVVLNQYLRYDLIKVLKIADERKCPLIEAEQEVLEVTHPQIGAWLAEKWNLPEHIVEVITFHHDPVNADRSPELVGIVYLANILCHLCRIGNSGEVVIPEISLVLWEWLQSKQIYVETGELEKYSQDFLEELAKAETFINFIQSKGN